MPATIGAQSEIGVGQAAVIESNSPSQPWAAVFEDDGETGYFYALDTRDAEMPIRDSLHIYNVDAISDRDIPSTIQIVWSSDGHKAGLIVNRYPHAVFDFSTQRGFCRSGFPPALRHGGWSGHDWDDAAVALLV